MDIRDMKKIKPDFLERAGKSGYVCPRCGNGSGPDGTGLETFGDGPSYHCFKCGFSGDVIDLFGEVFGVSGKDRIPAFREHYHIDKDINVTDRRPGGIKTEERSMDKDKQTDFIDYFKECAERNDGTYLISRGISLKTQKHFLIGQDEEWRSPKAVETTTERGGDPANIPASPRVIIPRSRYGYMARDTRTDAEIPKEQKKFSRQNVGPVSLFAEKEIKGDAVFVTEGEIDAMSIYEVGIKSVVALGSTANTGKLIDWFRDHKDIRPVCLLMLDNDEPGRQAQAGLKEGLEGLGIRCVEVVYPYMDPNEFLMEDPLKFAGAMRAARLSVGDAALMHSGETLAFFKNIESQGPIFEAKTGFSQLDDEFKNLYGGLHEGFYVLGAVSSEGKSTFTLQLGCQVAQRRTPVLFFATEQTAKELVAKCLSRETYLIAGDKKISVKGFSGAMELFLARDYWQIMNPHKYASYIPEECEVIAKAIENFEAYAENLIIIGQDAMLSRNEEGNVISGRMDVSYIVEKTRKFIEETGAKPLVIVDYLQELKPLDEKMSDKTAVDNSVYALKGLAAEYSIPVWAVSSFNRENYYEPVSLTSFKESGAIEYSADYLFGLQQAGMGYDDDNGKEGDRRKRISELRKENDEKKQLKQPVRMELVCLKQRNGMKFIMPLEFIAAFNYFRDGGETGFVPVGDDDLTPFGCGDDADYTQQSLKFL